MTDEEEKKALEWLYAQRGKYYKIAKKYIQKQQAEIEELKKDNNHQWEERCKLTFELEKKEADIEIKDKVINYMAKEINKAYYDKNHFYLFFEGNFDNKNLPKRINKIKQYFYKKVEEENE